MNIVDAEENRITREREDLETKLTEEKNDFISKLDALYNNIEGLNRKYETEYAKDDASLRQQSS